MERREQPTWASVRVIVLTVTALSLLPLQAQAERNWEFSVGAFGGKAFHSNEDLKLNTGDTVDPFHGTIHGVTLNDSGTFGGKLSAWYLPRKYRWQPQVGFELDFTRFTADRHPQLRGADGTVSTPGFQLGSVDIGFVSDLSVDTLAANLLFRYPVWSTTDLPQGRIAPYVGLVWGHNEPSCLSSSFPIEK